MQSGLSSVALLLAPPSPCGAGPAARLLATIRDMPFDQHGRVLNNTPDQRLHFVTAGAAAIRGRLADGPAPGVLSVRDGQARTGPVIQEYPSWQNDGCHRDRTCAGMLRPRLRFFGKLQGGNAWHHSEK